MKDKDKKIKLSKKSKDRINRVVSLAFCEIVSTFPEYDNPPEMWDNEERERWDLLQDFASNIENRLDELLYTN